MITPDSPPRNLLLIALCLAIPLPAGNSFAQTPRTAIVSKENPYRVNIKTSFNFPKKSQYTRVLVQHTLPSPRPWTNIRRGAGAKFIKNFPNGAITRYDNTLQTTVVEWDEKISPKGGPMSFSTSYEVPTASRGLKPEAFRRTKWINKRVLNGNEELRTLAEKILKEEPTAADGLIKFSQWLPDRVKYDDSVINKDLEDILKNGAGHCGHRALVFAEFCRILGIPTRIVSGMALLQADGSTDENSVNPNLSNNHTWVEVNLPGVGWIEAEPTKGKDVFSVPETFIQTKGFQTHRVRLLQNGTWVDHSWERKENPEKPDDKPTEVSPVGLKNTVSFEAP